MWSQMLARASSTTLGIASKGKHKLVVNTKNAAALCMSSQSKKSRTCPPMETYSTDASDENGNSCTCRGQQRNAMKATTAAAENEIDLTNDKNESNTTQMDHAPGDDSVVLGEDAAIVSATYAAPPVPTDNEHSDCGLGSLYLNDVEVDRNDEEQTITELVRASGDQDLIETDQNSSMRMAFGIILRLMLPLANGVVRGIQGIRDARFLRVLKNIASSRQSLTNLVAFAANTISMNLSSVQVTHHIEPILKLLKIRPSGDAIESLPDTSAGDSSALPAPTLPTGPLPFLPNWRRKTRIPEQNFCTLNVLAEPPPGSPIRADIIFIHGLHGSLQNTWKQGLWENERRPVEFERPPKQPVRPPKRQRNSRTSEIRPPHEQKRARFAISEAIKQSSESELEDMERFHDARSGEGTSEFSYICDEPKDIKICAGVEYSFPTFRLRMNDNGRLLQAELESMLNEENANPRHRSKAKLSPNDPNYSKCWPGDWLPLDCPGVRVIAVNYTTDKFLWRPLWMKKETRTNLIQRAREMAELLIEQRVGQGHPVVWVGHSKGGLFVKQILVDAWESGRPAMEPFWRSARGVFFYSVPHRGSHLASIKAPLVTRSIELIDIEKNSKYLLDLHQRFAGLYHLGHLRIEVFSFVETALTLMSVLYLRIVGVDSADPGFGDVCGIRLDHREICKPRSRDCILYKELVKMIKKVC